MAVSLSAPVRAEPGAKVGTCAATGSPTINGYAEGAAGRYAPSGGTTVVTESAVGQTTELDLEQTRAKIPQHDVDLGRTEIILRDAHGAELLRTRVAELWERLTFNPRTHRHVVVSKNEHGVKITLRALVYVDEDKKDFVESVFDQKQFEAEVALLGPDGRYLALIGAPTAESQKASLYVLDLDRDALWRLDDPPAPPPLPAKILADKEEAENGYAWEAPERHFGPIEPEIMSFVDAHTLRASYGKDDPRHRAKTRHEKRWDLSSVH